MLLELGELKVARPEPKWCLRGVVGGSNPYLYRISKSAFHEGAYTSMVEQPASLGQVFGLLGCLCQSMACRYLLDVASRFHTFRCNKRRSSLVKRLT